MAHGIAVSVDFEPLILLLIYTFYLLNTKFLLQCVNVLFEMVLHCFSKGMSVHRGSISICV